MNADKMEEEALRLIREDIAKTYAETALNDMRLQLTSSPVSNDVSRAELDARLAQHRAEGETQFEKLRSDIRELRSSSVGKTSFFLGALALFAAIVAVLAYGGQWFGLGMQSHDVLVQAAKEGAAQALMQRTPATPTVSGESSKAPAGR